MIFNLLLGLPIMVICLMLQSFLLVYAIRHYYKDYYILDDISLSSSLIAISSVMLLLVIGNLGQIAIWAFVFILLGEFQHFSEAFYHSAVNFSSLCYGDIVMSEGNRLLGSIEAVNGVLMVGVSTAALMSTFQHAVKKALTAKKTPIPTKVR